LIHACKTIQYTNYDFFVGVYPNDPATIQKVEEVGKIFSNVHAIVTNRPGPTTKADNLNQVFEGMMKYENVSGKRYDIIIGHDVVCLQTVRNRCRYARIFSALTARCDKAKIKMGNG